MDVTEEQEKPPYPHLPVALESLIAVTRQSKRNLQHNQAYVGAMSLDLRQWELSKSLFFTSLQPGLLYPNNRNLIQ